MKYVSSKSVARPQLLPLAFVAIATLIAAGCGSSSSSGGGGGQKLSGNTSVMLALSSTADDSLSQFNLTIQSLTLTSQSGKIVSVLTSQWPAEFIHINGTIEPLTTATLPQDIYTSAAAEIGGASFTCVTVQPADSPASPGSLTESTFAYGATPNANVTVNLPSPITITGANMTLLLNLQVSKSASFPSTCYVNGIEPFAITPTFDLTPATFSTQATNPENGKISELEGAVTAVGTNGGFTLSSSEPLEPQRTFSISSGASTVYQGISGFSALQVGTLVDLDGAIQPDGSIVATRIASYDPAALNVMIGPLLQTADSVPHLFSYPSEQQGQTYNTQPQSLGVYSYSDSTSFQISGQMSNVGSLPFAASFNSSNMVGGQNVALYSQQINDYYGGQYTAATTMTLMPQTVSGTVLGSSTANGFTDYTVSLASYDLFPTLATQPEQKSLLTDPSLVEVYVGPDTQLLNMQALASGSTLRFYGLVFNDNGTLRMDCARVNDGAPQSSATTPGIEKETGRTTVRVQGGRVLPVIKTITKAY